jgi:DNA-directed RNA polymerase specialized sigma24 family protein
VDRAESDALETALCLVTLYDWSLVDAADSTGIDEGTLRTALMTLDWGPKNLGPQA